MLRNSFVGQQICYYSIKAFNFETTVLPQYCFLQVTRGVLVAAALVCVDLASLPYWMYVVIGGANTALLVPIMLTLGPGAGVWAPWL